MSREPMPGQLDLYDGSIVEPKPRRHRLTKVVIVQQPTRQLILDTLREFGPMTDDELCRVTGIDSNSIRPRRIELQRNGELKQVGTFKTRSGRKAALWGPVSREGEAL